MLKKKIYDPGDLVELTKTQGAGRASTFELKPSKRLNFYEFSIPRKTQLIVIRHESGVVPDSAIKFCGSILCMSPQGLIWIDSRVVVCIASIKG